MYAGTYTEPSQWLLSAHKLLLVRTPQYSQVLSLLGLTLVATLLSACITYPPEITANPSNPIKTVAVLPFVNNTNDIDGPPFVRQLFSNVLGQHFYDIKPPSVVDQKLKEQMSVTLGSQLDMTPLSKLCETLGVDGVFYGALDDFTHKITGLYNVKRVRVRGKLVDCKNGQTVWKNGIGVKQVKYAGTLGAIAKLGADSQDKQETGQDLAPLFGDTIPAPWVELPAQDSKGIVAGAISGLVDKIISKATSTMELSQQASWATIVTVKGYFHIPTPFSSPTYYGAQVPSGPVAPTIGPDGRPEGGGCQMRGFVYKCN